MSPIDIAWAAGIYEGEGSVAFYGRKEPGRSRIIVVQKDPWILYRLQSLFGGSVDGPYKSRNVQMWRITGPRAAGFAMTIFSFLSPRRRQQLKEKFQWA